ILNMPVEFQWQDVDYERVALRLPEVHSATTSGTDMDNAVGILAPSHRPVVVVGRGAMAPEDEASIARFAERIEAPLATTLRGKGLFRNNPYHLGICGTLGNQTALEVITASDCLIAFGASLNQYT